MLILCAQTFVSIMYHIYPPSFYHVYCNEQHFCNFCVYWAAARTTSYRTLTLIKKEVAIVLEHEAISYYLQSQGLVSEGNKGLKDFVLSHIKNSMR